MSVMVRFSPKSMTAEQYDAILKKEIELGVHPVKGLEFEVCFGEGDQMKVSVVYDSMVAFEEHGKKLAPIVKKWVLMLGSLKFLKFTIQFTNHKKRIKNEKLHGNAYF